MRHELPTGTVSFLFTDVEGSTRLLQELGEGYTDVLAEHRRLLRDAFRAHGGVEVDTQGDAFFYAFARASDAVAAAGDAQAALDAGPVRVRIGVHTGEPRLTDEGYVGLDVHRAARVAAAAHGGQVLLTRVTRDLVDVEVRDLGEHRLKDLSAPERLFQLGSGEFPPLKTLYATNLPVQPSPLVGRERELDEIAAIYRGGGRLLTLTGAGGSGKTRLALHVAAELADDYPDGVWFVPLESVGDPALVEPTIAEVVGVSGDLVEELRPKRLLLVVDNLEHLLGVAPRVAELLAGAPDLCVLATSRERLALAAEQEYVVPSLEPDAAVQLFTQRASQLRPAFEPDRYVEQIARRLDGLPLALELAASRVKLLRSEQILERLGSALDLLAGGGRDVPARHRTLRAAIEWSYELLDERERLAFRRLGVFNGGFELQAAEHVCDADLDTVSSLVDKSLLTQAGDGRVAMLATIREHAGSLLAHSEEEDEIHCRHAEFYLAAAEEHEALTSRERRPRAFEQLAPERDNFRAGFGWAVASEAADLALRLAAVAGWYTIPVAEWHRLFERALPLADKVAPERRLRALIRATYAAKEAHALDRAEHLYGELLTLAEEAGDERARAIALGGLGDLAARSDPARARGLYEAALAILEPIGAEGEVTGMLQALGEVEAHLGNHATAARLLHECLGRARRERDPRQAAKTLHGLGDLALRQRDLAAAEAAYRESAATAAPFRDPKSAAYCLAGLAAVAALRRYRTRAAMLWRAVAEVEAGGYRMDETDRLFYARLVGDDVLADARPAAALSADEALELVLSLD